MLTIARVEPGSFHIVGVSPAELRINIVIVGRLIRQPLVVVIFFTETGNGCLKLVACRLALLHGLLFGDGAKQGRSANSVDTR